MTSMLLKPQSSLASLASSIRSEEQNKRAMSRQMPSAMRPSYQGLDSELLSLCQQSARSRHTSRDSHPSSDFSLVNFMPQNSTSTHSNSQPGQLGSPGGLGSPHMSRKRTSSSDLRRCSFDNASLRLSVSQTSQADGRSPFAPGAKPPFPLAMSRASSAEIQIRPAAIPMRAPSEGHNTPALTMTRAQSGFQAGVGSHVHIPWHLHTGARAPPQTALHISIHLRGGQPASGGRGSASVPQQRYLQQDTPAGWHCPCGHPGPADSTPGKHHRPLPGA